MSGFNVAGIIVTLIIWFAILFVVIFVFRYIVDSSRTGHQVAELAREMRMLRQELKARDERDRKEREERGRIVDTEA